METKDQDLLSLLPWYLNGTLDEASHRKIESLLQDSPMAQAEVQWLKGIRDQIRHDKEMQQLPPPDAGLDRLMAMIAGERSGKVIRLPTKSAAIPKWYRPALGIAAAVMIAQAAMLGIVLQHGPGADTLMELAGKQPPATTGVTLQITFKSTATEPQIRATLALVGGVIVDGPGVIGIYTVRVPADQANGAPGKLGQQKDVIDSVNLRR